MAIVGSERRSLGRYLVLGLLFFLYGIPILYLVVTSFKAASEIPVTPAAVVFTPLLDSVRAVLNDALWTAAKNSAYIAFGTAIVVVGLATPAAYGLARMRSGRIVSFLLFSLIVLQMVPQANSVIPLLRVLVRLDLLGSRLGIIFALSALLLPFAVIILRPFFASLPPETIEAARLDGASELAIFYRIAIPLARNGIATIAVLVWILGWGEFLYSVSFLPKTDLLPMSALMSLQVSSEGVRWGPLMALAMFTALPIVAVFIATQRLLATGLTLGAVK
ncbi:MAG: carbohydrate ABC transporter permease [Acidimicrobiia bacterium]|nr:carbohydrate ABC transporter permease [Acidimicrobiia bacterium]MYC44493.1 carbohydrate ABC transporter permease [Acidimicrobiia bacterium]MYI19018.1 carbohydrate ABC transporter permease [Acidimicrobiia bacterium]